MRWRRLSRRLTKWSRTASLLTVLTYTVPNSSAVYWTNGDSTYWSCEGGGPVVVDSARLVMVPNKVVQIHSVRGREGLVDSFVVDGSVTAHYFVQVSRPHQPGDTLRVWSCADAANVVFIPGSSVTGVPAGDGGTNHDRPKYCFMVDASGARIWIPSHHGVYWLITVYTSGRWDSKRVIH